MSSKSNYTNTHNNDYSTCSIKSILLDNNFKAFFSANMHLFPTKAVIIFCIWKNSDEEIE